MSEQVQIQLQDLLDLDIENEHELEVFKLSRRLYKSCMDLGEYNRYNASKPLNL